MSPEQMRRAALLLDSLATVIDPREPCALARLLREQADAMGWRDIATAPESCRGEYPRYVLFYNGHHRGVGFCYPSEDGDDATRYVDEGDEIITPKPTHWQPLPPPPQP